MPRKKQGHTKESATGGYLKKKTDPGIVLIPNESFKHFPINNELVFKIKKTVSSNISLSTSNEKNEREHIEASKSLNDRNMVSQNEVNNNSIEFTPVQDENKNTKTETENIANLNSEKNGTGNLGKNMVLDCYTTSGVLNVSVNNSLSIVSPANTRHKHNVSMLTETESSPAATAQHDVDQSSFQVITNNKSSSADVAVSSPEKDADCHSEEIKTSPETEKQSAEMSGVIAIVTSKTGVGNKTEAQQISYRISTSENRSNSLKDTANPMLEQNCHLPSSVYGTSTSSIENVLTGLQVPDKDRENNNNSITFGKISFLQEILEKKSLKMASMNSNSDLSKDKNIHKYVTLPLQVDSLPTKASTSSSLAESNSDLSKDKNIHKHVTLPLQVDSLLTKASTSSSLAESKTQSKTEPKLKIQIPEIPVNEDSNSSLVSSESQKILKFPRITSPQILEQHISKIISENAAIVETLDPMWSRRYFKQTSQASLANNDGDSKKGLGKMNKVNEEKNNALPNSFEITTKSKLQSALLGGCEGEILNVPPKFPTSPSNVPSSKEKNFSQFSNLSTTVPSANMYSKIVNTVSEDELKGSAIKSLLSLKQGRYSKHRKAFCFDKDMYRQHPQNPEGSIIKDLLLKSKSQEESKASSESEEKSNIRCSFSSDSSENLTEKVVYKCPRCFVVVPNRYNFELHLTFCDAGNPLLSFRDSTEKFRFKDTNAQVKPLEDLSFQYKIRRQTWTASNSDSTLENDDGVGQILKKQLLMPKSPPTKRRKLTDSLMTTSFLKESSENFEDSADVKGFPSKHFSNLELPPHRNRSQSVHLYGGEVQVLDGTKTKKIKIKTTIPGAFSMFNKFSNSNALRKLKSSDDLEVEKDASSLSGVVVTIAQPVHNNGGTVHLSSRRPVSSISPVVTFPSDMSGPTSKYPKRETSPISNFVKISHQSERSNSSVDDKEFSAQNMPYPYDFFPGPDSKSLPMHRSSSFEMNDFVPDPMVDEISPAAVKMSLSPNNKPFYSPIFSANEKSFELSVTGKPKEKDSSSHRIVPTVLFTPSSPTHPSMDNEVTLPASPSISEPAKKFLAPTRPTSLPLKKKPFTMVSSTLVSPETPRPKKSCVQLYLNGHAYTYLGLKCSTRSTYCSIYRPQPMFVPQETNPKLSMYSNWQVMPAKEELSGLTPGQMISFYSSKQQSESKSITVNSKLGEPLIFTHSSYWTYRSQDHSDEKDMSVPQSDSIVDQIDDSEPALESFQDSLQENSRKESVISSFGNDPDRLLRATSDSNLCLETENTFSDGEELNNSNEEDDDCQDDGTESLTDSSQPQPPKRVKICEGGFKSNEDYTYVRGRGRGKYVCEECGIRCKKPSMLKKHIRTHTDLRPYKCRHCSFAFKTKGNLTKHMKSKAHHKKCTELGIIPVPTTTDDSQIDEEALAKQIEKKKTQFSDGEDADDDEDEDSDESEDECESDSSSMISSNQATKMLANGHSKQSSSQEKSSIDSLDETTKGNESVSQHTLEQEAVRSLLNLSALGEPSQWSTSTGDLTDVTSSGETEAGSLSLRHDQSLLSPSQFTSQNTAALASLSRSKNMTDQWLSTETLGHRPRSYSADIPLGGGKESLAKFKLARGLNSENTLATPVDESSEFGIREQYARRYSISVAREARRPRVLNPPDWSRLNSAANSHKWLEGETSDQPMDLSITRDLSKCKAVYTAGIADSLLGMVTQEESGSDASMNPAVDPFGEPYQLKSLPVLSPQVLVEYETGGDSNNTEANLLSVGEDQASFGDTTSTRSLFYVQDVPGTDSISGRKDADAVEDPPSPDIADYAVCSPVSPPTLEDNSYYYPQENVAQSSSNPEETNSSSRIRAEFIVPNTSSSGMEEGKCICRICNKMFAKSSHLRLHVNIHYFERPFRCDNCAVSFRTKGHLQKHKRSVSHYNKVNMNMTFGTPTVDNPRPFKCGDCKIAFRIHGHLAKHLRSKMHIMKLECLGKLPFGMYAEMERSGVSLNEIDTTDCNNSLESLQVMAQKLYQRDPRRMRWQGAEQISDTGCVIPAAPVAATLIDSMLPINEPLTASFDPACTSIGIPVSTLSSSLNPSDGEEVKQELSEADTFRMASIYTDADSAISSLSQYIISQPTVTTTTSAKTTPSQETVQRVEVAESDSSVSLHRSGTCHICGRLFKSAKFLQVHLYCDHPTWNTSSASETSSNTSVSSVISSQELPCDLCGRQFPNQKALQQHLLSHAQPRPFVCELCDAGFTSSSSLVAHKATHPNSSYVSSMTENRPVQLK